MWIRANANWPQADFSLTITALVVEDVESLTLAIATGIVNVDSCFWRRSI
jgi:hypothetical protein